MNNIFDFLKKHWGKNSSVVIVLLSSTFWSDISSAVEKVNEVLSVGDSIQQMKQDSEATNQKINELNIQYNNLNTNQERNRETLDSLENKLDRLTEIMLETAR